MKIIKQPETKNWRYNHTCNKCDAVLEVEASDLIHRHYDGDFREPAYDEFLARCAVCENSFVIPSQHIPKLIQMNVIKTYGIR